MSTPNRSNSHTMKKNAAPSLASFYNETFRADLKAAETLSMVEEQQQQHRKDDGDEHPEPCCIPNGSNREGSLPGIVEVNSSDSIDAPTEESSESWYVVVPEKYVDDDEEERTVRSGRRENMCSFLGKNLLIFCTVSFRSCVKAFSWSLRSSHQTFILLWSEI